MATTNSEDHTSRQKLIDAAEKIMCETGYAAVTTRRVAAAAGLKPQLVHYHFKSMDELFLALLRRVAINWLERQDEAAKSDQPLRQMWAILIDARTRALLNEFVALSNHKKVIHCEMAKFASQFRNGQIALIQELFNSHEGNTFGLSARLSALLLHALASEILFEESFGLCNGHDEARDILENLFLKFDTGGNAEIDEINALRNENAHLRSLLMKLWMD